jgi:CubicO group peptidase (beta-lactamase class C family)
MQRATARLVAVFVILVAVPAYADTVDDYIRAEMNNRRIPGLALAVIDHGKMVKQETYGYASVELQVPSNLQSSFVLASLTKVFTAAAVMKLVDRGQLSLDEPVTNKLANLPAAWNPVTVRHCLDHMSGLPDALDEREQLRSTNGDDLLRALAELPVEKPGSHSRYNQTGFILLAMLVEKVSGQSLEDFITNEILKPAGMNDTRYSDSRDVVPHRVTAYTTFVPADNRKGMAWLAGMPTKSTPGIYVADLTYPRLLHSGAGLMSTIADLIKFDQAIDTGRVISPQSLRATLSPVSLNDGTASIYSLGWTVGNSRGWLPGSDDGFNFMAFGGANSVAYWRFPDDKVTVIVLTNLQGSDPHTIALSIAKRYMLSVARLDHDGPNSVGPDDCGGRHFPGDRLSAQAAAGGCAIQKVTFKRVKVAPRHLAHWIRAYNAADILADDIPPQTLKKAVRSAIQLRTVVTS